MFTKVRFTRQAAGWGLSLALMGFLMPTATLGAESQQPETAVASADHADLGIAIEFGGVVIMRIRAGAAGYDPIVRANLIYQRLTTATDAYRGRLASTPVKVVQIKGDPTLYIGDQLIVTVDEQTAQINGMHPLELAHQWAQLLKKGLANYAKVNDPVLEPPM